MLPGAVVEVFVLPGAFVETEFPEEVPSPLDCEVPEDDDAAEPGPFVCAELPGLAELLVPEDDPGPPVW